MKKEKRLFKFRVYEIIKSDVSVERIFICEDSRVGVSEKQIEARYRYTHDLYDHDNELGSVSYEYIFEFYTEEDEEFEIENTSNEIREDLIGKDDKYTDYGYVKDGIEFVSDTEANEYFED